MKTKLLGTSLAVFALLVCAGVASAATADQIQPASDVTYNENMRVNGTIHTDSLRVGTAGQGGVTFFNGSILNEDTSEPLTVADDLRVDGAIFRTEIGGNNNLKISDTIQPTVTDMYDLGTSARRWETLYVHNIDVNENIEVAGDIMQDIDKGGAMKAMVLVGSNGNCLRSWTYDNSNVSCSKQATGYFDVDFNFDVSDRYWQISPLHINPIIPVSAVGSDIDVFMYDDDGTSINASFMLTVY